MDNLLVGFYVFGFKSTDNLLFFNPLPNDKILDLSKFKAFADDKVIVTQKSKFSLGRIENIVGKGKNAGYQNFLLFPQCFQKLSIPEVLKVRIVWERVYDMALFKLILFLKKIFLVLNLCCHFYARIIPKLFNQNHFNPTQNHSKLALSLLMLSIS